MRRERGERKGEGGRKGTFLANANKINQKLLEEPNWGAAPFLTKPSSSCPLQLYRHRDLTPWAPLQALAPATAQQTLTSHPFVGHTSPPLHQQESSTGLKKFQPKTEWVKGEPEEGRGGKGPSKPLCSFIISDSDLLPFMRQPQRLAAQILGTWHTQIIYKVATQIPFSGWSVYLR